MSDRAFKVETGLHVEGGDSTFDSNTAILRDLRVYGRLQVDGELVFNLQGTADFIPNANGAYSLGSAARRWNAQFNTVDIAGATSFGSNVVFAASTTGRAAIRIPHGAAPTTPTNGDAWSTTAGLFFRLNGASKTIAFTDSSISGSANNTAFFGGQEPSYYLNVQNATGILPTARLDSVTPYNISISGTANNATNLGGQNAAHYLNAGNLTGTVAPARLTGTYNISISGLANNATNLNGQAASFYTNIPQRLGFTPVQQGTGVNQQSNLVKIGWDGTGLRLTVDSTDLGTFVLSSQLGEGEVAAAAFANNAAYLNGQAASYYLAGANITGTVANANNASFLGGQNGAYYLNAGNLTGTVAVARLSGTYNISISGNASTATTATTATNATQLNGQAASYYLSAGNLTGTIADARLPSTMGGKSFSSSVSVSGTLTASAATINGTANVDYLQVNPQNTTTEGGEIRLVGAGSYRDINIDTNSGVARIFSQTTGFALYEFRADNLYVNNQQVWHTGNFNPGSYLGVSATATNSNALAGQAGSYYLNASNFNAGILPSARLSGTYNINVATVGGADVPYLTHAGNINAGTLADARLPSTMSGKTFSSGVVVNGALNAGALTVSSAQINGALNATGDITAFSSSDIRLKTDIQAIPNALSKVRQIGGYLYTRKATDKREVGVIAQEIEKVLPEIVTTREDGVMAVQYERLVALLIEAVKEIADSQTK